MFLFSTPASPRETGPSAATGTRAGSGPVIDAIRDGAQATGVGFEYLLATAKRESALDPSAKAGTSSATGLFQFIEQTWLGVMKNAGPKLGLSTFADAITARSDGTYAVPDAGMRQTILDLRRDPKIASTLAGALTQKNGEALTAVLGREPTSGDLYAAHVLGARGATSLIASTRTNPERAAALDMPEAAAANRGLFYDKSGRPRTTTELYAKLAAAATGTRTPTEGDASALPEAVRAYTATGAGGTGDLRSLFQTDKRGGAISAGVAKLWQGRNLNNLAPTAPSYFPRSEESDAVAFAEDAAEPETTGAIGVTLAAMPASGLPLTNAPLTNAPLPPRRPAEFAVHPATAKVLSLYTIRSGP